MAPIEHPAIVAQTLVSAGSRLISILAITLLLLLLLCAPLSARTLSRYALLLQDPPAAASRSVVRIGMGPEVATARETLRKKQTALRADLLRRNFHVTGASQILINAIYVAADPSRLAELSRLPGVRRIAFLPPLHPALDHAEQLIDTPAAWAVFGGMSSSGLGVKIAVIDSGIDQTHPAFQDPLLTPPSGYPLCQPEDCAFTNNKVIVARSYIRQQAAGSPPDPAVDSRPDDYSPRDHQGHGTAVAMVIAGETNTGPGDTITGLAPKAFLGSYKVFGSPGVNDDASEDAVIQALEDAVTDGMDIANLSLGGPPLTGALDSGAACGEDPGVPCDTLSQAIESATTMGMLVVAAAGNQGGTGLFYPALASVSTPAIAPSAIAVAATTNSHVWIANPTGFTSVDVTGFNTVASFSSRGPAIGTAAIKPEIAAPGANLFLAAQNYDPGGDLYSPLRYTISNGTSFSSPMVAGSGALVKQIHPDWQPWQIKSALVNTATQDITDNGQAAGVPAVGAGKLNSANALAANITVNPATASFGVIQKLPATLPLQVRNNGSRVANLQVAVQPVNAAISVEPSTLTIAPGDTATLQVSLTGSMPPAGSYQGFIVLQGDAVTLHIPYLYLISDGVPNNLIKLLGDGDFGAAGREVPDGMLAFEVIDRYGLPLPDVPVSFGVSLGGGQIVSPDPATNQYGIATAQAITGTSQTTNVFTGTAAGMTAQFVDTGVPQPAISDNGVVNAASYQLGPGIAPGSYVSIFGSNLSTSVSGETTVNLPVSIRNVSVSFDVPEANLSVPGHLIFVTPQQVNVQVPWELQGRHSVQMKVSIENASGAVSTVPVADYSPGIFTTAIPNPAIRGQTITLYGTGFGPVNHPPASGDPAPDSTSTTLVVPVATIGVRFAAVPATVQFCGLAPGYAGLYQLNITIPADVQPGLQPLIVSINGIAANAVLLPVQ